MLLVGLAIGYVADWMVGRISGFEQVADHRTYRAWNVLRPVIADDPAFKNIVVLSPTADHGVILQGTVGTQADHIRLHAELARRFGEDQAAEMIEHVAVGEPPNPP